MRDGFIKVGAATPKIKVADCEYNGQLIREEIKKAAGNKVNLLVFPELCLTGYTCGDLFLQDSMLRTAKAQLIDIARFSEKLNIISVIGLPYVVNCKLYNVAAFVFKGKVLGMIPKTYLPNYSEFYEVRHFTKGNNEVIYIDFDGEKIPFGTNMLFQCSNLQEFVIGCEICEDLWVPNPPSVQHALNGATIICNPSASVETTSKEGYRKALVNGQAARLVCGYIYADAGEGESTTDVVYSGHNIISENGSTICEAKRFTNETVYGEIDLYKLAAERRRMTTYFVKNTKEYVKINFSLEINTTKLTRTFSRTPFIPSNEAEKEKRCDEILMLQSMGLKKRLEHVNAQSAVIGLSGGLDSTLAFLVTVRAFDMLKLDRKKIIAITMPGFGTTNRTYNNAVLLANAIGATLMEISIVKAVKQHFEDIDQEIQNHDITYENSQARERTQILMDIANKNNGLVIGTGDMSELALGWATYNGDHMSMYAVNASVPKTLVKHLVSYYAAMEDSKIKDVLLDILDTPVSPELLPPDGNEISQITEDIVGPYELHDFYLYYILRFGFSPSKLFRIAALTFDGVYDKKTILKWLKKFYYRFFGQQFKRSCIPDGPKVGSVALSPRGDLRMPSDASAALWINELEELEI